MQNMAAKEIARLKAANVFLFIVWNLGVICDGMGGTIGVAGTIGVWGDI